MNLPIHKLRNVILITGVVAPFLARIPGSAVNGISFLGQYVAPPTLIFVIIANIIPFVVLALLLQTNRKRAVFVAYVVATALSLLLNGLLDLSSSSTASLALIFFPIVITVVATVLFLGLSLFVPEKDVLPMRQSKRLLYVLALVLVILFVSTLYGAIGPFPLGVTAAFLLGPFVLIVLGRRF